MDTKIYYAICVNKSKVLNFVQEDSKFVMIYEFNDISLSSLLTLKEAESIIKEITNQTDSIWEYSNYYKPEELDIVKVEMKYGIIKEI